MNVVNQIRGGLPILFTRGGTIGDDATPSEGACFCEVPLLPLTAGGVFG